MGDEMMNGVELIAKERDEQITKHGYVMDGKWVEQELVRAAIAALLLDIELAKEFGFCNAYGVWPWRDIGVLSHVSKKPRIEQLVVVGALIAAEIDRMRLAEKASSASYAGIIEGHDERV